MSRFPRQLARTLIFGMGFGVVILAATTLPQAPGEAAAALAAEALHLACALLAGVALLRLPRWQADGVPDLLMSALALGLALQALLTLGFSGLGLTHRSLAWLVDALLFALGAGQARLFMRTLRDAWVRAELSFVMASRIPLLAALSVVAVMHVVPPLVPPTAQTGGHQLSLPRQALIRGDLREAVRAQPGAKVRPSTGLLLHGELASGHAGAGLHGLSLMLLLAVALALHAGRHCSGGAAAWATLSFASAPAAVLLSAGDISTTFLALYSFLAFHEVADWCTSPSGGKIVLAAMYSGLALAESPAGGALLVALLLFLFLTQALVDRHGFLKQLPGVAGMAAIAVLVALPFLGTSFLVGQASLGTHVRESLLGSSVERSPADAPSRVLSAAPWQLGTDSPVQHWKRVALALGPLLLGLVLLIPLVPSASDGLRHGLMAAMLAAAVWCLPPPFGTAAGLLPLLALCAGTTAAGLLESTKSLSRTVAILLALALPVTVLLSFQIGPNSLSGASFIVGASSRAEYLAGHGEDFKLIADLADVQSVTPERSPSVLLIGDLSDWLYTIPRERWAGTLPRGELLARALRTAGLSHVAVAVTTGIDEQVFSALTLESTHGDEGSLRLYSVPAEGKGSAQ